MPDASPGENDGSRTVAQLTELAGGLAHELRNPLSTMMINLKLLAEDLGDGSTNFEDIRRRSLLKVERLRREAQRLQNLFDEFLSLTGPYRLQRSDVDVDALTDRLIEFFKPLATKQGIQVRHSRNPEAVHSSADESLLRQALLNLVVNAQQAMPDGGTLTIASVMEDGFVRISVSDTGVGIARSDQDRIVRPFYSTKAGGTGLGLSITQRIVQEHGGSLTFESQQGVGTTFTIQLPHESADRPDSATPE